MSAGDFLALSRSLLESVTEPPGWDEFFIGLTEVIASKSKDPRGRVGCVIVSPDRRIVSTGFNGFPSGVIDSQTRYKHQQTKRALIVHADANAVYSAARAGSSVLGCTMYLTAHPCDDCAKVIAQSGIARVLYPAGNRFEEPDRAVRWKARFDNAALILREAGVELRRVDAGDF